MQSCALATAHGLQRVGAGRVGVDAVNTATLAIGHHAPHAPHVCQRAPFYMGAWRSRQTS